MEPREWHVTKCATLQSGENEGSSLLSREWQTLALGLGDGIVRTGNQTAIDLKQGACDLANDPLGTTGRFLKNHWTDAATGAAITFLKPTKWANAMIMAYSLRGVGYATAEAGIGALSPDANINRLRNDYAEELSHQGTAFLSSMPLAMLGGHVGKAGANAVFGKNLGALDLASGRVSPATVKENLWNIHDAIRPPAVKLVVTDLDNTIASFSRYFAEGTKNAISELSLKTQIPEAELYKCIGRQMELYPFDCPWSVELALKDRLKVGEPGGMSCEDFSKKIAKPFFETIDKSLKENLELYPTVRKALEELKSRGIPVAVLSDAPAGFALQRLRHLGLDNGLVDRLYGLSCKPPSELSPEIASRGQGHVDALLSAKHGLSEFRVLPQEWEKPNPSGIRELMKVYDVRPKETLMIGDSRLRDVGVAHSSGAGGIWAEYGKRLPDEVAVLNRLDSGGFSKPAPGPKPEPPPHLEAAQSYERILAHLNPQADYLAVAKKAAGALLVRPQLTAAAAAFSITQPGLTGRLTPGGDAR